MNTENPTKEFVVFKSIEGDAEGVAELKNSLREHLHIGTVEVESTPTRIHTLRMTIDPDKLSDVMAMVNKYRFVRLTDPNKLAAEMIGTSLIASTPR